MDRFFKYCTKEQELEFLSSLKLGETRTLYAVSNNINKHYQYLEIPKKNGKKRKLMIPDSLLKQIQKSILEHILYGFSISSYVKSYRKKGGILENALPHLNQPVILKLDIKHFFDSITFDMIKATAFPESYFPESIRTLLTIFCCHQNKLPQGAPTSPYISNIILKEFDEVVGEWCLKKQIIYTRYCDDLTFSGSFETREVIDFINDELKKYGFELNHQKTKLLRKQNRQIITGIVVNQKPNTPRYYRKEIRKQIYYIKKYGLEFHLKKLKIELDPKEYLLSLKGKIRFVLYVDAKNQEFQNYMHYVEQLETK